MKTAALIIMSFITVSFAQPYKTIRPGSETYFINQNGIIKGIKIKAVAAEGSDSVYYNFNSIRPDSLNCQPYWGYYSLTPKGASWIGERIVIKPDGKNLFFNKNLDTIVIETKASVNDSWQLCKFPNGDWFEGTVSAITYDTVMGIADSIKIISLQLKDSSNNLLTHPMNSKSFAISKAHGLISTLDIYNFPDDSLEYLITDKGRLTTGEIYDFEVGDERQIKGYSIGYQGKTTTYNLDIVIGKEFSSLLDSVFYEIQRKTIRYHSIWDSNPNYLAKSVRAQLSLRQPMAASRFVLSHIIVAAVITAI